jgi:hypothetical protein
MIATNALREMGGCKMVSTKKDLYDIYQSIKTLKEHDEEIERRICNRLVAAWQGPPEQLQYYIAKMKGAEG